MQATTDNATHLERVRELYRDDAEVADGLYVRFVTEALELDAAASHASVSASCLAQTVADELTARVLARWGR